MNGRSQAVRIPKAYRFNAEEVSIRKEGEAVILEPIKAADWPRGFFRRIHIADDSFARPSQGTMPEITPLDRRTDL
ncbi:antitoxin [Planctomycetota bacterium]